MKVASGRRAAQTGIGKLPFENTSALVEHGINLPAGIAGNGRNFIGSPQLRGERDAVGLRRHHAATGDQNNSGKGQRGAQSVAGSHDESPVMIRVISS